MNTAQRIAKNAGALLISNVVSRVLAFIYIMYIARYLSVEDFGVLSFALAFTGIFGVFTDFGLGSLTIREVARNKSLAVKYLANISMIKVVLGAVTFGLIALIINVLGYPKNVVDVVYFIALSVLFSAFTMMINSIFKALERMEFVSLGQVFKSILIFVGVIFAIRRGFDVVGFAIIYFVANIIVFVLSYFILRRNFPDSIFAEKNRLVEIDWPFWKSTMTKALPFGLSSIFVTIYFWIDTVMISLMKGNIQVGYYNAPYKIIIILIFMFSVFSAAIYPVVSRHYKGSKNLLKKEFEISFKYLFVVALFIFICGLLFADKIILIVYGKRYGPSIEAFQVLIWVIPFAFSTTLFGTLLAAVDKQVIVLTVTGVNAVLNVFLNLLLIPNHGYIGASLATVFTEVLGFILMGFYIMVNVSKIPFVQNILKPVFCTALTSLLVCFLMLHTNWILSAVLGGFTYIILLIVFHVISEEDVNLFRNMSSKVKETMIK